MVHMPHTFVRHRTTCKGGQRHSPRTICVWPKTGMRAEWFRHSELWALLLLLWHKDMDLHPFIAGVHGF